ncbi:hypothetical protein PSACC_00840 [Paramicrosporidium saccamoebae]|uniref:Uncharacterized protein n=1 Tax=Paramicrosporidium saccamoebae TaxID=1246581 RepID=A0A2H9TNK9_9FUNG|nr:hypothetical protein PSACC_00840 [Paramicrosporidium saccamoebae]
MVASDHFATKRYVRSLVQGGEFDELDFLRQTSRIAPSELTRVLLAVAEELQQELTLLVNEEFESFVKLFNDIGDVGQEEFQDFEEKVANLYQTSQVQHSVG